MTQVAQPTPSQIVAIIPRTTVSDLSFIIRAPEFSEGVRRGQEFYQGQFANRDTFASDVDILRFLTSTLTPFSPYAAAHAGALFGCLQALSSAQGRAALSFKLPAFEKAFLLGETDYREGSLEDLDCDTELICFLARELSPRFDRDLSVTNGALPVELQRIAGYVCGVVMALLNTPNETAIVEHLAYPMGAVPHLVCERHLLSSHLPLLPGYATTSDQSAPFHQLDDFSQGYVSGWESARSDYAEGRLLQDESGLWAFLSRECHPKTVARERKLDLMHGWECTPLAYRTGFLAGYLHAAFVLQQPCSPAAYVVTEEMVKHAALDSAGWPLDM